MSEIRPFIYVSFSWIVMRKEGSPLLKFQCFTKHITFTIINFWGRVLHCTCMCVSNTHKQSSWAHNYQHCIKSSWQQLLSTKGRPPTTHMVHIPAQAHWYNIHASIQTVATNPSTNAKTPERKRISEKEWVGARVGKLAYRAIQKCVVLSTLQIISLNNIVRRYK